MRRKVIPSSHDKELPGMPKRTPLGEKVIEYLNAKDESDRKAGINGDVEARSNTPYGWRRKTRDRC